MKIIFLTTGTQQTASSRTRVFQYLPYLNDLNIQTNVFVRNPYFLLKPKNFIFRIFQRIHIFLNTYSFFICALFYKIIFLQKVYLPKYMIKAFQLLEKKIIYDFDDAIYITEKNADIKLKKLLRLNYTLKNSSLIIVENELNKAFAEEHNTNTIIITGPIECIKYSPEKLNNIDLLSEEESSNSIITLGWIGSSSTTMYLDVIKKPLEIIAQKFPNIQLLLVGASTFEIPGIKIISEPWSLETEVNLLSKMDIGIMPLFNDKWSNGKGGYKLLQYMAMGLPSVATNCGINGEIITHGKNGFLASNEEEWVKYLEILISDVENRKTFGINARERVCNSYSFEHYTPILIKALTY